jgi:hypothetical protein
MDMLKDFGSISRNLARNPLGIIALFIVLVYGLAGLVISIGKPEFFTNPYHPAVIFIAAFPPLVLLTFVFLVSFHHTKLYGPTDFQQPDDFWRNVVIPKSISQSTRYDVVVSDGAAVSEKLVADLASEYDAVKNFGFALLHQAEVVRARTSPKDGLYRIRLWIEDFSDVDLDKVASVTYRLWPNFTTPQASSSSLETHFEAWITTYGEFPVLAKVQLKNGQSATLQRYVELPGRPPD